MNLEDFQVTPIIKLELTEKDVREAIADYVNRIHPHWVNDQKVDPLDVKLEIGTEYYDRQPGHTGTPVFKKAVVTVKTKQAIDAS